MSIVNGSDLYMWMDGELIAYSTSYTLSVNMEVRPGTNKGSGLWKKVLPGMFDASGSCDGLYVFESSAARIMNAMLARNPVTLQFGVKETGTNDLDTDTEHFSGDFYITSFDLNATDAENATYSTSFVFSDNFGVTSESYWWVATDGSDATGTGEYNNPWLTLGYAVTQVTTPGETINVKNGTYNIGTQVAIPVGVSIRGQGDTSVFVATAALNPMFTMSSASEGTNGNQSISYIRIDGDDTALTAIVSKARSNISLHHCTFENFSDAADVRNTVNFDGRVSGSSEPTIYGTGLRIYDNTFHNCGQDFEYSAGTYFSNAALVISGQNGALIYNNTFTNDATHYGYGIRCINGYLRGVKIYDNDIQVNLRDQVGDYSYAFAIELWTGKGGVEIYRNTCTGGIDFSGYGWDDTYGYGFALKVYDNTCILAAQPATIESGLVFESGFEGGVYVYNNYVENFQTALVLSLRENSLVQDIDGFYIYYNIFAEIGQNATMTGYGMQYNMVKTSASYTPAINDFRVYNNVFYRADGTVQIYGIEMSAVDSITGVGADWSNISVLNNIWFNVYTPCKWENQTVDEVTITNNISHNATNNNRFVTCTLTNDNLEAMATDDPTFVSATNYHLQAGSPAINAGVATGQTFITTDYDGRAVGNPPEIGAYEYV